jgi:hypothetical protein
MAIEMKNFTSAVKGYLRLNNFPLDASSIFDSFASASQYAETNGTAYAGQLVAVVNETDRTVGVYQLGFPANQATPGFELQLISGTGSGAITKSVNDVEPDTAGNVEITANDIQYSIDKTVKQSLDELIALVGTLASLNDIETSFEGQLTGIARTLRLSLNGSSIVGSESPEQFREIPINSVIKKIVFEVSEPFEQTDITVSVGEVILMSPDDIYETVSGTYISEHINQRTLTEGNIEVNFSEETEVGSANIYVEFIESALDDLVATDQIGDYDGGSFNALNAIDTALNGGQYTTENFDGDVEGGDY